VADTRAELTKVIIGSYAPVVRMRTIEKEWQLYPSLQSEPSDFIYACNYNFGSYRLSLLNSDQIRVARGVYMWQHSAAFFVRKNSI
jgi:hypothetical protein